MKKSYGLLILSIFFILIFYILSLINYDLFHLINETIMLIIAISIFIIGSLSQELNKSSRMKMASYIIILSSSVIFLHALTYKGMNLIDGIDSNLPTQLWIIANYILSLGLLFIVININKEVKTNLLIFIFIGLSAFFVILAFVGLFPNCYIEGSGLTQFKKVSEVIIIFIYAFIVFLIYLRKKLFETEVFINLILVFCFLILGEFVFIFYVDVYGILNFSGHIFRLIAFLILFNFIYKWSVKKPIDSLLLELEEDETEILNAQKDTKRVSEIFKNSIMNAPVPIMIHVEDGTVLNISDTFTRLTNYTKENIKTASEWTEKAYGKNKDEVIDFITMLYKYPEARHEGEFEVTTKDGRKLIWKFNSGVIGKLSDGKAVAMSVAIDITDRIAEENKIIYMSTHDYLTDLYNRRFFSEQYKKMDHIDFYPLGVMMLDINGLKIINDAFGHKSGDSALKKVANILKSSFRKSDIIARLGGDEFAVILPNITAPELELLKDSLKNKLSNEKIENIVLSVATGYEIKNSGVIMDADEILKFAENHMYRHKVTEGKSVRNHAINAILKTLTDKYDNERIHSQRVSNLCKCIGEGLGIKNEDLKELELAGLYHDIGKISIPDAILNKPGRLTKEEFDVIKTHPEISYQILRAADEYSDLAIHALHHHERWDGNGYPSGLKGENIPLFSRIICVADSFEAMTALRPYKDKMSVEDAIDEIIRCSGTQFDPKIADAFIKTCKLDS
ncbi:MASE3 domain-containing protein [Mariniplasma anaerobium]|uniref:Diguanylate cyclase n=1 Tax=Mariniplasma anaerobium TaxID=2735436 RepID=A0A7U9XV84_9MOLU|nr:MASE3 domain-containing protein [Mariniplasma anaerobium]BCR35902.1 hypothetical protein MPAN_007950 [Mariniplasma anaerobium]